MPFQCIICLQPLIASGDHPAAIPCGHVYHKSCLHPWVREHRNCPLCKKACNHRQIISPLYLSSDDEQNQTTYADTSEQTQVLRLQVIQLTHEKETANTKYNQTKQELLDERKKSQEMATDLRGATKAIRHMKQIRRERDDAVRKSSILERDNLHLQMKIERLKNKLLVAEAGNTRQNTPKPKRAGNVIILDSDEDEDESNDDDESDGPVVIAESSNQNNNRDDHSSSRLGLKRLVFTSSMWPVLVTLTWRHL
ncbi:hypothetical protein PS15m_004355 [Mucor circinelloides]